MSGDSFEVHVSRNGRWQIEGVTQDEKDAVSDAKKKLTQQGVEGVKVIKDAGRRFSELVTVFEQQGRVADGELITLGSIDTTPKKCEKPADLYGGGARQTMAKLFKNYSSKMNLTVSEVLHSPRELKRVMEKDNLVTSAVSRVASLQSAGESATATKARRDELFSMLDHALAKANQAEKTELPSINTVGFAALEEAVAAVTADPSEAEYLKRVAISRELIGERSFLGKLDNAVKWVEGADANAAVAALDDFIADTLNDASLIQDIVGPRENLLAAITAMLDLLDGQMPQAKGQEEQRKEVNATGERLNKLIAASRLPGAVEVIAERLRSMIASRNLLQRDPNDPPKEKEALRTLVERLVPADGNVRAGTELLDGLIERGSRHLNQGGVVGRQNGLEFIADLLLDPARKMRLLIAVWESGIGEPLQAKLQELFERWITDTPTAAAVHPESKNPALVMRAITNLFYRIRSSEVGAEIKANLMAHLDTALYKYVVEAKIIERVDDPAKPLRQRARMLMSMCLPDMLPPGKAVEAARPRVVNYLRQPNFTVEVVADVEDPKEKEKVLRDLFDLMSRAGFK